jgi:hypothetical protein
MRMSHQLTALDKDTRLGALKREAHWSIVIAATGGGLTFTWVGHLMQWTPLDFLIHGAAGIAGGYLVGTGIARLITGMRVRPLVRRYENVGLANRIVASAIRCGFGIGAFALSYLWAIGFDTSVMTLLQPQMIGVIVPIFVWGFVFAVSIGGRLVRAAR